MIVKKSMCCLPLLLLVAFCAPSWAQETKTDDKEQTSEAGVVGAWKWKRDSISGKVACQVLLTEKDGKISGTYSDEEDVKAEVGEVKVDDDQVTIAIVFDNDGEKSEVKLEGKLAGDKIVGKMIDGSSEQDWKAKRFVALQQVQGKWRLSFTTPDGVERNPEFEVKIKDDKPEVKFIDDGSDEEASSAKITSAKFSEGLLVLKAELEFQGNGLTLEYELEYLNADELEGSMFFEMAGTDMSGDVDVSGERIK